ncbi:MAG: hypothetical protein Q8P95_01710, partial [bacterium]|nr:hypothetical protein [bacterium]
MNTFMDQFRRLLLEKPRYNLKGVNSDNCDYADTAVNSKDCYYSFGTFHSEDLLYSRYSRNCEKSADLTFCFNCQWCYQCIGCSKSYGLKNCKYCSNCSDCSFCEDCTGCKNCFGSIGLHQKEYYFFNEDLSKEEYEQRLAQLDLSNPEHLTAIETRLEKLRQKNFQLSTHQTMCEDCVGDNLVECKSAYQCFDAYDLEDCQYCIETNSLKNCCDMTVCFNSQESYQCIHCPNNYGLKFCYHCDNSSESEFCAYSANLKNCFGCVYLKDKQYHILNQPYEPEEYRKKVAEIKKELIDQGLYNLLPY